MSEPSPSSLPDDAKCLGCAYALRGIDSDRCPECGRSFDQADPLTYHTHRDRDAFKQRELQQAQRESAVSVRWVIRITLALAVLVGAGWFNVFSLLLLFVIAFVATGSVLLLWILELRYRARYGEKAVELDWTPALLPLAAGLFITRLPALLLFVISIPFIYRVEANLPRVGTDQTTYGFIGVLPASEIGRCQHGLHVNHHGDPDPNLSGVGFFRRDKPGDCRFVFNTVPIGFGWYMKR